MKLGIVVENCKLTKPQMEAVTVWLRNNRAGEIRYNTGLLSEPLSEVIRGLGVPAEVMAATEIAGWCDTFLVVPKGNMGAKRCPVRWDAYAAFDVGKQIVIGWFNGRVHQTDRTRRSRYTILTRPDCDPTKLDNRRVMRMPGLAISRRMGLVPTDDRHRQHFLSQISADPANPDSCWVWAGPMLKRGSGEYGEMRELDPPTDGYDITKHNMVTVHFEPAHRFALRLHLGAIPDGLHALHTCSNKKCVRFTHLYAGDNLDNCRDRELRNERVAAKGVENGRAVLTDDSVRDILRRLLAGEKLTAVGRRHGVDRKTVKEIQDGKTWRHVERSAEFFAKFGPMKDPKRKYAKPRLCAGLHPNFTLLPHMSDKTCAVSTVAG